MGLYTHATYFKISFASQKAIDNFYKIWFFTRKANVGVCCVNVLKVCKRHTVVTTIAHLDQKVCNFKLRKTLDSNCKTEHTFSGLGVH